MVVSLVGAWGACGGAGERRGDGVPAPPSNPAPRPDGIQKSNSTRSCLADVHESRRRKLALPLADSKDEIWDPKSPPSAIPNVGVSFQITQTPLRFSRGTTCGIASQPTCPGSALDRRVLRDLQVTQQEILVSNNLKGKRRTISTSLVSENPRAKCAARYAYLIFPSIEHVQRRRTQLPSLLRIWETREL